jgi:hypothetical protein
VVCAYNDGNHLFPVNILTDHKTFWVIEATEVGLVQLEMDGKSMAGVCMLQDSAACTGIQG